MINKTLAQMNAERAAGPARHNLKLKASAMPTVFKVIPRAKRAGHYEYHPKCCCPRCRASRKLQATSVMKKTQLNNKIKK